MARIEDTRRAVIEEMLFLTERGREAEIRSDVRGSVLAVGTGYALLVFSWVILAHVSGGWHLFDATLNGQFYNAALVVAATVSVLVFRKTVQIYIAENVPTRRWNDRRSA